MKKQIIIILILCLVIIGLWYGKNGFDGLFGSRVVITSPTEDESIISTGENNPVLFKGTALPNSSVYIYPARETCVKMNTEAHGGGGVDANGNFSISLFNIQPGQNTVKALNVTETEEKELGMDCYPKKFFSKSLTFTLSK
jgi:hypothetical protein